jgi:hypothetical protein
VSQGIFGFIESSGAVGLKPNQMTVKVPEIDCKKYDKPINFIVRVSSSAIDWAQVFSVIY